MTRKTLERISMQPKLFHLRGSVIRHTTSNRKRSGSNRWRRTRKFGELQECIYIQYPTKSIRTPLNIHVLIVPSIDKIFKLEAKMGIEIYWYQKFNVFA